MNSRYRFLLTLVAVFVFSASVAMAGGTDPYGNEDPNKKTLKQGLLGAATGAISAEASGGKAGTGALVGAGTNVIGGALLDTLTAPSQPQQRQYAQPQQGYAPQQQGYSQQQQSYQGYADPPRQQVYQQPVYAQPPQQDQTKNVLKQGLLGAGTGALAAGASGGKAGKGALIGAGTNIIGGALLDVLTQPSQPQQPAYYPPQQQPQGYYQQQQPQQQQQRKIIRKYDADGNVVSEEEVFQ